MTPEQRAYFQQLIQDELEQLSQSLDTSKQSVKPVKLDQSSVGRLSRMDAMQGQAMSLELERRKDLRRQQLNDALVRVEQEDYGLCEQCDEAIAHGRLEIDPAALLCIKCASK